MALEAAGAPKGQAAPYRWPGDAGESSLTRAPPAALDPYTPVVPGRPWAGNRAILSGVCEMLRVLVVDDEPAVRDTVSRALERAGHDTVAVATGMAGMAELKARAFDAIVTDICMPEQNGIELIRTLRAAEPNVPILAISGGGVFGIDGSLPTAQMLGARATLRKPFAPSELVAAVEAITAT